MAICKVSLSLSLSLDFCCFCRNMLVGAFLSGWSCWMHMNATKGDQCLGICCGMSFPNIFAEPWIQNNMSHRFTRLFFTRFHTLLNIYIYIYCRCVPPFEQSNMFSEPFLATRKTTTAGQLKETNAISSDALVRSKLNHFGFSVSLGPNQRETYETSWKQDLTQLSEISAMVRTWHVYVENSQMVFFPKTNRTAQKKQMYQNIVSHPHDISMIHAIISH